MFCQNCGAPVEEKNKFCANCGALVSAETPESTAPSQPVTVPAPESKVASKQKKTEEPRKVKKEKNAKPKGRSKAGIIVPIAAAAVLAVGVGGFFIIRNKQQTDKAVDSYTDLCEMTKLGTESYLYARVLTERILEADVIMSDPDEMDMLFDECIKAWEATGEVSEDMADMAENLSSDSSDVRRLNLIANPSLSLVNRILYGRPVFARSNDNEIGDVMAPGDSIEQCVLLSEHISTDSSSAVSEVRSLRSVYNGRQTNIEEWNQTVVETSESFSNTVILSGEVVSGSYTQVSEGQPVSVYQISTDPKPGNTTIDNTDTLVDVGSRSSTFVMSSGNSITINSEMDEYISSEGSTISMSTHTSTTEEVSMTFHSTSFTSWYILDDIGGFEISRPDKYDEGILTPPSIERVDIEPDPVRRTIVEWIPAGGSADITSTRQTIIGETIEEDEYEVTVSRRVLEEQIDILQGGSGDITVSVIWGTHDDLDLHVITPNDNRIYYGNTCADGGVLDIDENASSYDLSDTPVENVYFAEPLNGHYEVYVRDYRDRTESISTHYLVVVKIGNDVEEFEGDIDVSGTEDLIIEFDYDDAPSSYTSTEYTEEYVESILTGSNAGAGDLTVTLMWDTWDDLDLHVITPDGSEVSSFNPYAGGGILDKDANSGTEWTIEPVENIYFAAPSGGQYIIYVEDFNDRSEYRETNYFLKITVNGETQTFNGTIDGTGTYIDLLDFNYISRCYVDQASYVGHTYAFIDSRMTWRQARDFAESYGGHLVTISDEAEMSFVMSQFPNTYGWIGLINPQDELVWVTGEPVSYTNICPEQPANYDNTGYYGFLYNNMQWAFTYNEDTEYHYGFYIEWDYDVEGSINGVLSQDALNAILASNNAGSGPITISILWDSDDDLDLHVFTPDASEIYYNNRQAQGGYLDIDANTVNNIMADPIENVYFTAPANGDYWIYLNDYEDRSEGPTNFIVRIIINGEATIYSGVIDGSGTTYEIAGFTFTGVEEGYVDESTLDQTLSSLGAGSGEITVSMLWDTDDDLDLHMLTPDGSEIYYSNRNAGGGELDYDANVGGRTMDNPIENIFFEVPGEGIYQVWIVDYSDRSDGTTNYIVRVTVGDQSQTFSGTIDGSGTTVDIVTFEYGGSGTGLDESTLDSGLIDAGAGNGEITVSMLWDNDDDLDLHVLTPDGSEICYSNTSAAGGVLDVDANVGGRTMDNPVENIYFEDPVAGTYQVWVENYSDRTDGSANFIVRVTVGGESQTFNGSVDGSGSVAEVVSFTYG